MHGASISNEIDLAFEIGELVAGALGRAHLHIARARALEPRMDRRQPALVGVGRENLAFVVHRRRERERFAAGAGAQIDHLLAAFGAGKQRCELRAFVLDFNQTLDESGLGMDGGIFRLGFLFDAKTERRPARGLRVEIGHHADGFVARAFERIDAQVERRARGQRRALLHARFAEHSGEMRIEPFRIVSRDMRRRVAKIRVGERMALQRRQRLGRKARAIEQLFDCVDTHARVRAPACRAGSRAASPPP